MKKLFSIFLLLQAFAILNATEVYLPIYSDPIVFLNEQGEVKGQLPIGWKILNTLEGK